MAHVDEAVLDALEIDMLRPAVVMAIVDCESVERLVFDRLVIDCSIQAHVANWRKLLTAHVHDGRQLLREVLTGPLRFTPDGKTYRFEGSASIGGLLAGVAGLPTFVASPVSASWNQLYGWLSAVDGLRRAA